jgi:hypothetical protein
VFTTPFANAQRRENAERLCLSISNMPQIEFLFKKRLTLEMTWGETSYELAKGQKLR